MTEKLDINSASLEEWMSISGVGPARARAILRHKKKVGAFKSVSDLGTVPKLGQQFVERYKDMLTCRSPHRASVTPHRELRSSHRQPLKRKLPLDEKQATMKVTRQSSLLKPHTLSASRRFKTTSVKTPQDIKLDLLHVYNQVPFKEATVSTESPAHPRHMSLRSQHSDTKPPHKKFTRSELHSDDLLFNEDATDHHKASRGVLQKDLEMAEWLETFMSWTGGVKLQALDRLMAVCEASQVRHVMQVIEPQFQRDFISLLPKELALYVLSFLEPKDLLSAAQTCSYWHTLAEDNLLWKEKCQEEDITELLVYPGSVSRGRKVQRTEQAPTSRGSSYKCLYLRQKQIENNWKSVYRTPKLLKGHDDHVITCLEFSGNKIVSGSDDNTLKVWSATTGRCLRTLWGHTGGVWSSQMSGSLIISGSTDRTLRVWNAETGLCKHTLSGHTSTVRCMHLHNKRVVSGSRDATLRVWDVETGQCLHILIGHVAAVRCVQYDGVRVVSGGYDYMVKIWDPETETCLQNLSGHTNRVYSLQFDGNHIVSGSLDTSIRVWNVETGVCVQTLIGHQSLTSGMELKNNILVSGNADSTVKVWNITTGQCLQTFHGPNKHLSAVTCLQFNGNLIITSSDDGTVKLWDLRTGDFIRNLVALESGGSGGVVWRIRCSNTKLVCAVGSRNGTEDTKLLVIDFGVMDEEAANQTTPSTIPSILPARHN